MPKRLSTWFLIMGVVGVFFTAAPYQPELYWGTLAGLFILAPIFCRRVTFAWACRLLGTTHPANQWVSVMCPSALYGIGTYVYALMITHFFWSLPTPSQLTPFMLLCASLAATYAGFVACLTIPQQEQVWVGRHWVTHPFCFQAVLHFYVCLIALGCAWHYGNVAFLFLPTMPVAAVGAGMWVYAKDDFDRRQDEQIGRAIVESEPSSGSHINRVIS